MPDIPPYVERLQAKREETERSKQGARQHSDVLAAIKAARSQPPVILPAQSDVVKALATKMEKAIKGLDNTELSKTQVSAIRSLGKDIQALGTALDSYQDALRAQTVEIVEAINGLELSPKITVPRAQVTVNERDVDLSPVIDAINASKPKKTPTLSDYRADDIDTAPDGTQYILAFALDGSWYIAQADKDGRCRYHFGTGDYSQAWDERIGLEYQRLAEAIRGLRA